DRRSIAPHPPVTPRRDVFGVPRDARLTSGWLTGEGQAARGQCIPNARRGRQALQFVHHHGGGVEVVPPVVLLLSRFRIDLVLALEHVSQREGRVEVLVAHP